MKDLFKSRKSEKRLKKPLSFDHSIANNIVQPLLDDLFKKVEIINSTADIQTYFSTYDECITIVKKLIPYERMQGYSFSGDTPSSMLRILNEKMQPSLHNFLERSAKKYAFFHAGSWRNTLLSDGPVELEPYESFCLELKPFFSRFDDENRLFLENQCKDIFLSDPINSIDSSIDPMIEESISVILSAQQASTTLLQRKLRLGYARAARLIDELEQAGIVAPSEGNTPRKVLTTYDEYINNRSYYLSRLNSSHYNDWNQPATESNVAEDPFSKEIDNMNGYEFEAFCCKVLAANNYLNIKQTKLSGDDGIDIIAEKEGINYGFQCKCYSSPVGIKAVQEAFTGAKMYNCDIAVVITNNSFTPQAIHAAEQTRVRLWARSKLIEMSAALSS